MYLSESQVRAYPSTLTASARSAAQAGLSKSAAVARTVFLSHSHEDRVLVEGVRLMLASQGVSVYVDWKDAEMPAVTNPETAKRIRAKIASADKFVMLASNLSLLSRWVPWELGIGEVQKTLNNVAVLPVIPDFGAWEGNEYVGIYSRIEPADDGRLAVFGPGSQSGIYLTEWLNRK